MIAFYNIAIKPVIGADDRHNRLKWLKEVRDMVKLFTLSTCPHCKKVKRLLDGRGVKYDAIDVDLAPPEEKEKALAEVFSLTGQRGFPVTVIGNTVVVGNRGDIITEALNKHEL